MQYRDNTNITKKYWTKVWHLLLGILSPVFFLISLFTRRELHSTTYLWALLKSKWYHWRCELPAGQFIFGLYFCIIAVGTGLLVLSQFRDWYLGPTNLDTMLAQLGRRWEIDLATSGAAEQGFVAFCSWCLHNAYFEGLYLADNLKLGLINMHNWNLLVDALFTATSATCLTGMTSTDIAKYPPWIIISLVACGAASLTIIALYFNINSFFFSESSKHGSLSLAEYGEGRRLGHFTLKAMYGFILVGILSLTIYFLPETMVESFLKSEYERLLLSMQQNFIFIFIWLAVLALICTFISKNWQLIKKPFLRLLRADIVYYLTVTSIIAACLMWFFYAEGPWQLMEFLRALSRAFFLSFSAFTNAGFDTNASDLATRLGREHANQWMTGIIMLLIFFGSLGMQVVRELPHVATEICRTIASRRFSLKRLGMKISFHTKLVLLTNIFLWLFAAFMFWFLETHKGISLEGLSSSETLFTTAFQAINMRTAGFSIHADVSLYSHPTLLLIMIMMLIGGSPNSMSGGMKVSTVAILFLVAKSLLERREDVHAFGESISQEAIHKAMTTFVLTICSLALALMLIFSFYDGQQTDYFKVAFDVVGAFTTIGLNTGINDWNIPCKLVLIICMCFGKIGVLTIGMSLYNQTKKKRSTTR